MKPYCILLNVENKKKNTYNRKLIMNWPRTSTERLFANKYKKYVVVIIFHRKKSISHYFPVFLPENVYNIDDKLNIEK